MKMGKGSGESNVSLPLFESDISLSSDSFARARAHTAEKRIKKHGIVYHSAIQIYYSLLENIVKPGQ